ncbi:MAG: hypothetical protein ACE1Z6_14145 [Candidatus Methylomirabilales bacterium]
MADLIPYVECDRRKPGSDPGLCNRLAIKVYPTWFIKGVRYEGVLSVDRLAKLSDFQQ